MLRPFKLTIAMLIVGGSVITPIKGKRLMRIHDSPQVDEKLGKVLYCQAVQLERMSANYERRASFDLGSDIIYLLFPTEVLHGHKSAKAKDHKSRVTKDHKSSRPEPLSLDATKLQRPGRRVIAYSNSHWFSQ